MDDQSGTGGRRDEQPAVVGEVAAREVSAPPLALYRRYRPDTFAQVIGQGHVTEPLQRALANNRVNHAYLFSGPRGCGKTTSARILARSLNCEQGPAPIPCGKCDSCRDLARGGPGSIDVIEIDAASHGGVEDARDLRERAFYAPVSSRYKVYIVDEAHMVTTAGFNALLKLVEEPPPHVKFVFATTEPEKVIGTIRSRTHHYPFRLVPPKVLGGYLHELCEAEGIAVEPAVLPLVVRAGGGSVRDSLSVLDQLLGGASADGVSYAHAAALLGYTPDSLLDEMVDSFAAGDAAGVFAAVDKVIEVGQDPRRFAEDLLRRLRDLVIVDAVPDAVSQGLVEASDDQAERLQTQAAGLGPGELARAAEVIAEGLTEMRGTTAPRLYLELMCARVLLPGADVDERGLHARLERLERRVGMDAAAQQGHTGPRQLVDPTPATDRSPSGDDQSSRGGATRSGRPGGGSGAAVRDEAPAAGSQQPAGQGHPEQEPSSSASSSADQSTTSAPAGQPTAPPAGADEQRDDTTAPSGPSGTGLSGSGPSGSAPSGSASSGTGSSGTVPSETGRSETGRSESGSPEDGSSGPAPAGSGQVGGPDAGAAAAGAPADQPLCDASPAGAGLQVADLRRLWPEVLEEVKRQRRFTWILLSQNSHVMGVDGGVLTLGLTNVGARDSFARGGSEDVLREALVQVLGADLRVQAVVDDGTPPATPEPRGRPGRPSARPGAATADGAAPASQSGTPPAGSSPASPGPGPGGPGSSPATGSDPASASSAAEVPAAPPPPSDDPPEASAPDPPGGMEPAADPSVPVGRTAGEPSPPGSPASPDVVRAGRAPTTELSQARSEARASIRPTRPAHGKSRDVPSAPGADADARRDDTDLDESTASHNDLLALHLGAELIAEEGEDR